MAKKSETGGRRPQNLGFTLRALFSYLGRHSLMIGVVGVLAAVSALANLLGTYMIRPVVNSLAGGYNSSFAQFFGKTALGYGDNTPEGQDTVITVRVVD